VNKIISIDEFVDATRLSHYLPQYRQMVRHCMRKMTQKLWTNLNDIVTVGIFEPGTMTVFGPPWSKVAARVISKLCTFIHDRNWQDNTNWKNFSMTGLRLCNILPCFSFLKFVLCSHFFWLSKNVVYRWTVINYNHNQLSVCTVTRPLQMS